jgi:hypothetical protein
MDRLGGGEVFNYLVDYYKKIGFELVSDLSNEDDGACYLMRKKLR